MGFTQVDNDLLEAIAHTKLNGEAVQVLMAVIRRTFGYNRAADECNIRDMQGLTGLLKPNICRALRYLQDHNIVTQVTRGHSRLYAVNMCLTEWQGWSRQGAVNKMVDRPIDADKAAFEARFERYPLKTGKAAAMRLYNASVLSDADVSAFDTALNNYLAHLQRNPWKNAQAPRRFFAEWKDWVNHKELSSDEHRKLKDAMETLRDEIGSLERVGARAEGAKQAELVRLAHAKARVLGLLQSGAWSWRKYDEYEALHTELRLCVGHDKRRAAELKQLIKGMFLTGDSVASIDNSMLTKNA